MPNIFESVDTEQQDIEREADDIAANITKILVDAFKAKENRDPTAEELEMLLSELTEERIAEMLGEAFVPRENASDDEGSDPEDDEDDEEVDNENVEEVPLPAIEVLEPVVATPDVKESLTHVVSESDLNGNVDDGESATKKRRLDPTESAPEVI